VPDEWPPDQRRITEPPPKWRTEYQRDRDRILYSSAFRRLTAITQVTAAESGLGVHNRITHSLKVAQVARRLAERLKSPRADPRYDNIERVADLDVDAVEACALAHDLGHPPFGHVAEDRLNDLMKNHGGFEGNAQSFRIITRLATGPGGENRYRGLNLTRATLNGVLKYPWERSGGGFHAKKFGAYSSDHDAIDWVRRGWPKGCHPDTARTREQRSLEAELMDWADDVTYAVHDLEDFHRSGLIPFAVLAGSGAEQKRFASSFDATTDRGKDVREIPDMSDDSSRMLWKSCGTLSLSSCASRLTARSWPAQS
jgi:dGTPase